MEANTIDFVSPTPSLHSFVVLNKIVEIIAERIKGIPNYHTLRLSLDVVLFICNMIENLTYENGIKAKDQPQSFKKDIAVNVYKHLDWVKEDDKQFLVNSIQFLWSSGRIKKISFFKRIWAKLRHFLMR
jgi:uncharacterized protein YaeQ